MTQLVKVEIAALLFAAGAVSHFHVWESRTKCVSERQPQDRIQYVSIDNVSPKPDR